VVSGNIASIKVRIHLTLFFFVVTICAVAARAFVAVECRSGWLVGRGGVKEWLVVVENVRGSDWGCDGSGGVCTSRCVDERARFVG
jgi:hypothetical protein